MLSILSRSLEFLYQVYEDVTKICTSTTGTVPNKRFDIDTKCAIFKTKWAISVKC